MREIEVLRENMNLVKIERDKLDIELSELKIKKQQIDRRMKKLTEKLNLLEGNCYYVYIVFVDGQPKYVGKGKGDRYKHAISGASSVPELNRDFFNDCHIEVRILFGQRNLTEKEAIKSEKNVTGSLMGIFDIYNRTLPKENEYSYMDCNFMDYSEFAVRNKGHAFYTRVKTTRSDD